MLQSQQKQITGLEERVALIDVAKDTFVLDKSVESTNSQERVDEALNTIVEHPTFADDAPHKTSGAYKAKEPYKIKVRDEDEKIEDEVEDVAEFISEEHIDREKFMRELQEELDR